MQLATAVLRLFIGLDLKHLLAQGDKGWQVALDHVPHAGRGISTSG